MSSGPYASSSLFRTMETPLQHPEPLNPYRIDTIPIYPSIGLARVGNSKDAWFIGPELPARFDEPTGGFKDDQGAVKRQAARFRVYVFDAKGKVLCEVNRANGFEQHWSLQVANQKPAWYTFMGSQQDEAFKPGNTTLRNLNVQPDVGYYYPYNSFTIDAGHDIYSFLRRNETSLSLPVV